MFRLYVSLDMQSRRLIISPNSSQLDNLEYVELPRTLSCSKMITPPQLNLSVNDGDTRWDATRISDAIQLLSQIYSETNLLSLTDPLCIARKRASHSGKYLIMAG